MRTHKYDILFIVSNFTVFTVDWKSFAVKDKAF